MIGLLFFVLAFAAKYLAILVGLGLLVLTVLVWWSAIIESERPGFRQSPMTRTDVIVALLLLFGPLALGIMILTAGLRA
jgi:hypothetical protein